MATQVASTNLHVLSLKSGMPHMVWLPSGLQYISAFKINLFCSVDAEGLDLGLKLFKALFSKDMCLTAL